MGSVVRLENWQFTGSGDTKRLFGTAYGHPRVEDGHRVSTSLVDKVIYSSPPIVITQTGTNYQLGEPDPSAVDNWKNSYKQLFELFDINPEELIK